MPWVVRYSNSYSNVVAEFRPEYDHLSEEEVRRLAEQDLFQLDRTGRLISIQWECR